MPPPRASRLFCLGVHVRSFEFVYVRADTSRCVHESCGPSPHKVTMLKLIPNIPVADVERSVEFYRHVLGFELVAVRGRGDATRAHLRLGPIEIIFRSLDTGAPIPYFDPALENQLILHIQVEDVIELFDRVKRRVHIIRSLEPTLFGSAEFMMRDIDGRILAFSQPAGTPIPTKDGPGSK